CQRSRPSPERLPHRPLDRKAGAVARGGAGGSDRRHQPALLHRRRRREVLRVLLHARPERDVYRRGTEMTLSAGARLGPHGSRGPLGAGGMGEVSRPRDPRLSREVAIKVLPASISADPDRLRRFEQEAKAAGVLAHPNITAVYDTGSHDGAPYVVQELLEG